MLISTPAAINSRTALNSSRSTVNHQEAKRPRSLRLISMSIPPHSHSDARQSGNRFDKGIPPDFEIAIMVERCTGGRQKHDGARPAVFDGVPGRDLDGPVERARFDEGRPLANSVGEFVRRLTDEIGAPDLREERGERRDSAGLRNAARDPIDLVER